MASLEEITKRRLLHKIRGVVNDLLLLHHELEREPVELMTFARFEPLYRTICLLKSKIEELKDFEDMGFGG